MKETIIQFGEGNFLRGFFDYFLDVLNKKELYDGKAVVIQPRAGGKCALLNEQNCDYNLYLRGISDGKTVSEHTFINSVSRGIDPYKSFEEYLSLADNEDFRFVVSNTTEAGIVFDNTCRLNDRPCKSFTGKLTQLLYKRYKNGMKGFIFLPCELIDNNADVLKECILKYADLWQLENEFKDWLLTENVFYNTLVDRIVTGYPNDETAEKHPEDKFLVAGEIFHLWVIEGNIENELPLKKAGFNVVYTDDVTAYKKIKVRILNGAHTSMVPAAILSGLDYVGQCMENETVYSFLERCMKDEILFVLGNDEVSRKFMEDVFDRFRNPFIKHKLRSIALNSVSKFAVRVLPSILDYKRITGNYPKYLSMSLAYLLYFYKNDKPEDSEYAVQKLKNSDISDILSDEGLWQTDLSEMTPIITEYYNEIDLLKAKGAMEWILS